MSALGTASCSSRWMTTLLASTGLIAGSAQALENLWLGTTNDWNTPSNWSLGRAPVTPNGNATPPVDNDVDDATVNSTGANRAIISATIAATPRDFVAGRNAGNTGRLDHTAGTAQTGGGSWMFVGTGGGNGSYNLANTANSGGTLTTYGQGTGSMTVEGRLNVGQAGSNGTVNVNTSGSLTINGGGAEAFKIGEGTGGVGRLNLDGGTVNIPNGELWVGQGGGSTGVIAVSGGTVNANNLVVIGRAGGQGTFNLSGGTFNKTGGGDFVVGGGGAGLLTQSGGLPAVNNTFRVGDDANGTMTQTVGFVTVGNKFWVGQAAGATDSVYNLSAGSLTVNNWVAIGRGNGKGTVNMTGGTFFKAGNADARFIVGASGTGGGTMNQSGGLTDVQAGISWTGEEQYGHS